MLCIDENKIVLGEASHTNIYIAFKLKHDHVETQDERRIEVIANCLPLWGRAQLAVDTTLASSLTRAGQPRMRREKYRGRALSDAKRNKERTYPEFFQDRQCRLVVLEIELGGRWSDEASTFLRFLAGTEARQAPVILRHSLATTPFHQRDPRGNPTPPSSADYLPLPTETGLDFAIPHAHPGAAERPTSCRMLRNWTVKQPALPNSLRPKKSGGEKKTKKRHNLTLNVNNVEQGNTHYMCSEYKYKCICAYTYTYTFFPTILLCFCLRQCCLVTQPRYANGIQCAHTCFLSPCF